MKVLFAVLLMAGCAWGQQAQPVAKAELERGMVKR